MNQTVLSTKLLIPKPRQNYLVREALFRRLDELTNKRLTVIKGLAGSGKTTLLTSYITQRQLKVKWITLNYECNHVVLFWHYVAAALEELLGVAAQEFVTFLKTNIGQNINEALKVLINALNQSEGIVLVMDDFHLLDNYELLNGFEYFLANISPNIHFVLLTRTEPTIYLSGYQLRDELLWFDEQDLLLSEVESIQFLKQTLALSGPEADFFELVHKCNGWIGGLQLLATANVSRITSKMIATQLNNKLLYDYIENEVFAPLSPDEQDFLILTAVPTYFNQDVGENLLPYIDYETVFARILKHNLMIQCFDEAGGWFQYHDLLRSYLLEKFRKLGSQLTTQVYRELARIFDKLGDETESLRHLLLLEDYDMVMRKILQVPVSANYYFYMDKITVNVAARNFEFAFQKFFYHYYIYDYPTCTALYDEAIQYCSQDQRYKAFFGATFMYKSEAFGLHSELLSLEQIQMMELYPLTRALILTKNAAFLFHQNQYLEALAAVNESIANERKNSGTYIHYFNLTLKIQICEEMGLLNKAFAVQEQIRKLLEENQMLYHLHLPTFAITMAGLYMKQMRLTEALQVLRDCKAAVQERGGRLQLIYDYNWVEYLFLTDDTENAISRLEELLATEVYEDILTASSLLKYLHKANATSLLMQERFMAVYEASPVEGRYLNSRLLYARILKLQGKNQEALMELDEILRLARKRESYLKIVEAVLQKLAILVEYSEDFRQLTNLYKEALYYASENNICLPFYLDAAVVVAIQQQYSRKLLSELSQREQEFHGNILKLCVAMETCLLSKREQEILQAIADGLSNYQIAEKLYISLPTVKTHVSNIFRKLEVKSRVAALDKSRQLGILY